MDFSREAAILEAIIFIEVSPVSKKELCRISKLDIEIVTKALEHLKSSYERDEHGIELSENSAGWAFVPKSVLWSTLKDHYVKKKSEKLSRAAMETLSIVAYFQPVTRNEIEDIRGVSCESIILMLKEKKLICSVGKKDIPGKPTIYGTTEQFLDVFELKSIADLPKLEENDRRKFDND